MIGTNELEVKKTVKWEKNSSISGKRIMKATLALQQSGLKSVCVGSTWP